MTAAQSRILETTPDWMRHAVCAGCDPELFFPERGGDSNTPKAICRTCPVRQDCLNWALDHHEIHGVWGGTSERERRMIRRERAARRGIPFIDDDDRLPVRPGSLFTRSAS